MKTALLHYWLTNRRGGEQVLAELGRLLDMLYTIRGTLNLRPDDNDWSNVDKVLPTEKVK